MLCRSDDEYDGNGYDDCDKAAAEKAASAQRGVHGLGGRCRQEAAAEASCDLAVVLVRLGGALERSECLVPAIVEEP